jgi:hypothetical protein
MPRKRFGGNRNRQLSAILYAAKHKLKITDVKLCKICYEDLYVEPDHYCQQKDLTEGEKDGNGFTETKRKMLLFRLGLLFDHSEIKDSDCIRFQGYKDRNGYGQIVVDDKGVQAHVLSLRLQLGRPLLPGMQASHTCDSPSCVRSEHLVEETQVQNIRRQKRCQLTNKQITQVYNMKGKISAVKIAKLFKITPTVVYNIHKGRAYIDITKHKSKVPRTDFQITESMRDELTNVLKKNTTQIYDEELREFHTIPHRKPSKDGYVRMVKWGYAISFHMIAVIIKNKLSRFPESKKDEYVLHSCRRRDCCAYEHVSIGTAKQNAEDKKRDKTHKHGGKLTSDLVEIIKTANGTYADIARRYNTTENVVTGIKLKRTYINISQEGEPPRKKARTS